jgi:hypothetical protein
MEDSHMSEEVQNQTLALLREMRKDIADVRGDIKTLDMKVDTMARVQLSILSRVDSLEKKVSDLDDHMRVVAIVVDNHDKRLGKIEGDTPLHPA